MRDIHKKLIPPASKRFESNRLTNKQNQWRWRIFADYVQRNKWMRADVYTRDFGQCQWCLKEVQLNSPKQRWVLHHSDYNHICLFKTAKPLKKPTVPDCYECCATQTKEYVMCMRRLHLVHSGCNYDIHKCGYGPKAAYPVLP